MCLLERVISETWFTLSICYQILLNNVLYGMVCMIIDYTIFVLCYQDIEEIEFGTLLEFIVKEDI